MTLQDAQTAPVEDLKDDELPVEPLPPEARRALPMVWLVLGTVAVALLVGTMLAVTNPSAHFGRSIMTRPGAASGPSVSHP